MKSTGNPHTTQTQEPRLCAWRPAVKRRPAWGIFVSHRSQNGKQPVSDARRGKKVVVRQMVHEPETTQMGNLQMS